MTNVRKDMVPVESNRSYVKGKGACVNVNDQAYQTRIKRLKIEQEKDQKIQILQDEIGELKSLVKQLLDQGKQ